MTILKAVGHAALGSVSSVGFLVWLHQPVMGFMVTTDTIISALQGKVSFNFWGRYDPDSGKPYDPVFGEPVCEMSRFKYLPEGIRGPFLHQFLEVSTALIITATGSGIAYGLFKFSLARFSHAAIHIQNARLLRNSP